MLQAEVSPITISIKGDRANLVDGQLLGALEQTRQDFESLKDKIAAVVS